MAKPRRRQAIIDLLRQGPAPSQDDIVAAVQRATGETVTQSTISRDLRELGVVKSAAGYHLPDASPPGAHTPESAQANLANVLKTAALSIEPAAALVVVRTTAGHASMTGLALDHAALPAVVGNVAGDDTVFIATRSPADADQLAAHMRSLAGL